METIHDIAQLAVSIAGIIAAGVAAIQSTRWGKAKAVQTTREILAVLDAVAAAAVRATEQEYRKAPAPRSETEAQTLRQEKAERALGHFYQLLPQHIPAAPAEAKTMIERALHDVNAEKSRVDTQ